ncbi:hypothetical protein A3F06_01435 [candidate division TM6 bacterium RIFCSPHIGHO2_12_FULL_36_22]|nr:MAG: hypothetical protein A3F06_01435 [candidate division TM6 bacterium RIFCSPHIGHO2_12_FULL_36_22]
MNRKKSIGIVLKKQFPRQQKISLLDQTYGRIEAVPISMHAIARVSHGSLVEYVAEQQGHHFILHDMQLLATLPRITEQNMLFFHHILEIVYFDVPLGAISEDVFHLLISIQQHLTYICAETNLQKLALGKLYLLLGADVHSSVEVILQKTLQSPDILQMIAIEVDQTSKHALDAWVHNYIQTHPCAHMFKTINFLTGRDDS